MNAKFAVLNDMQLMYHYRNHLNQVCRESFWKNWLSNLAYRALNASHQTNGEAASELLEGEYERYEHMSKTLDNVEHYITEEDGLRDTPFWCIVQEMVGRGMNAYVAQSAQRFVDNVHTPYGSIINEVIQRRIQGVKKKDRI